MTSHLSPYHNPYHLDQLTTLCELADLYDRSFEEVQCTNCQSWINEYDPAYWAASVPGEIHHYCIKCNHVLETY